MPNTDTDTIQQIIDADHESRTTDQNETEIEELTQWDS